LPAPDFRLVFMRCHT